MIVIRVFGAVHQGDLLAARRFDQSPHAVFLFRRTQLGLVAVTKMRPVFSLVAKPFSQGGAGGQIFAPLIVGQIFFADATRPQAIDQDPVAVGTVRLFVCPLDRSEEHTSELQSLMRISYAVFCLKKKIKTTYINDIL